MTNRQKVRNMDSMLKGTKFAQQLDFAKTCYLQGLCTLEEYRKAKHSIYKEAIKDVEEAQLLNDGTSNK